MGWSGSLTAGSPAGTAITYAPDTAAARTYTTSAFTAPKKGIYRFTLKGSGGNGYATGVETGGAAGGTGGLTVGHLFLQAGDTVYVGCGGVRACAFVSKVNGASLAAINQGQVYFVAGAGGQGGRYSDGNNHNGYNCRVGKGGDGGGAQGAAGEGVLGAGGGGGGTQTGPGGGIFPGAYGAGTEQGQWSGSDNYWACGGGGGDGWYGGGGAGASSADNGCSAGGGGGGSGYVASASLAVNGTAYANTTQQGGGAPSNGVGSVQVTYVAAGELPVIFDGTRLTELFYNGVKVGSLIYNGTKLFCRRTACFTRMARPF